MVRRRIQAALIAVPAVLVSLAFLMATSQQQQYHPSVGQEGKDVIWVPTPDELVTEMLNLAKVTSSDHVIDLGSGDGKIVIAAAKRGARAMGVEFNPDMVELSRQNAQKAGVSDKATFVRGDIFETDFSQATVLTMYLLPDLNLRLRPKVLDMKPGTRVVSHAFSMQEWDPDETIEIEGRTAYLWIVPAKVAGTWTWQTANGDAQLSLRQTFQKVEGSLKKGAVELPIRNARLEGEKISFTVGEGLSSQDFSGFVHGKDIDGTVRAVNHSNEKWSAHIRAAQ